MTFLAAVVVASMITPSHVDTTVNVKQGARLEVSNFTGGVFVTTWDRSAVRIQADRGTNTKIGLDVRSDGVKVSSEGDRGTPGNVEYQITVPTWMALDISGPFTDVDIDGSRGDIKVETVKGDVSVNGGSGFLELSSVEGNVEVAGAKGRMKLSSVNEGVTVSRVAGQLEVETVNGNLVIDNAQLDAVEASSVSGDLWFNGTLKSDGRYHLQSHGGDIDVVAGDHPDAVVSVSTFSGDFSSDFDVTFAGTRGHRELQFTLGDGGPRLELESFSGNIRLLKASAVEALRARLKSHAIERETPRAPEPPKTPKSPKPAKAPKPPKDMSRDGEE